MRKNFYVFLDIDGVMYDWPYIIEETEKGNRKKGGIIEEFKPDSVDALKFLFEKLSEQYDVNLVISSTWRSDMAKTFNILYKYDLLNVKKVEATKLSSHRIRGVEIKEYLKDKDDKDNYCIIDDETSDIVSFMSKDKIIKTSLFEGALNKKQVKDYLVKIGVLEKDEATTKTNLVKDELVLE